LRELFKVQLKSEQAIIGLPVHFIKRNSQSKQLTIPEIFLFGSFWRKPSKAVERRGVQDLEQFAIAYTGSTTGARGSRGEDNAGLFLPFFIPVVPVPPW
jgi:hypothetical protein